MSNQNKTLILARNARKENNTEDAKKFYDMVRTEEPENGEARFFYQYYSLYEGKNIEIGKRFQYLLKALEPSISCIVNSNDSDDEKYAIAKDVVETFVPMTWTLNRYMNELTVGSGSDRQRVLSNDTIKSVCISGVIALYNLGDFIIKEMNNTPKAKELAIIAWKEAVSLNQKWYAYKYDGKNPEEYANKIKEIEPSYEMPKKAGCISFAGQKN